MNRHLCRTYSTVLSRVGVLETHRGFGIYFVFDSREKILIHLWGPNIYSAVYTVLDTCIGELAIQIYTHTVWMVLYTVRATWQPRVTRLPDAKNSPVWR